MLNMSPEKYTINFSYSHRFISHRRIIYSLMNIIPNSIKTFNIIVHLQVMKIFVGIVKSFIYIYVFSYDENNKNTVIYKKYKYIKTNNHMIE